jgi:hypothetical protein
MKAASPVVILSAIANAVAAEMGVEVPGHRWDFLLGGD